MLPSQERRLAKEGLLCIAVGLCVGLALGIIVGLLI